MAYLFAIIAGLLGAIIGWAAGGALEPVIAGYRSMLPNIEIFHRAVDVSRHRRAARSPRREGDS